MIPDKLNIFHVDLNYVCLRTDFLRTWLKRVAKMGFNAVLWELEDKVQWETCPECVWPQAMSKNEFKELLGYSRSLGLEPIPLLQTIGHAEYVLIHKAYRKFRELDENHDCYCTSNPEVVAFLTKWIEEYLDLFGDIRFFHLGGDEAYVFGKCPKCAKIADKFGKNKLYGDHINALAEPVMQRNVRPGIWNDMIMRYPDSVDQISREFVIWDWNYWGEDRIPEEVHVWSRGMLTAEQIDTGLLETFPELLNENGDLQPFYSARMLKRHGFDVILCSSSSCGGDNLFCPTPVHAGNVVGVASTVVTEDLMGNCVTSWAIRLNGYLAQTPFIGLATLAMKHPGRSSNKLLVDYCKTLFGVDPEKFIEATRILGVSLPFAASRLAGLQWNGLKDSLPAPEGYLREYLKKLQSEDPDVIASFSSIIRKSCADIPEGIRLLTEFFTEAKTGLDIIEYWLAGAHFLLLRALIGQRILANDITTEAAELLKIHKQEYAAFLRRRETPESAAKNAELVFNALIEFFKV